MNLDAIEARARGSIIRGVGQWPPTGATPEETIALVARVRELEAELAKANRDPFCASCLNDWCQGKGTDIGDEDEDVYLASCTVCGRDME